MLTHEKTGIFDFGFCPFVLIDSSKTSFVSVAR